MAAEQYRTSVSLVFWTATPEDAQARIDEIGAALPNDEARAAALANIEYIAEGKPEPPDVTEPEPATNGTT